MEGKQWACIGIHEKQQRHYFNIGNSPNLISSNKRKRKRKIKEYLEIEEQILQIAFVVLLSIIIIIIIFLNRNVKYGFKIKNNN